MNNTVTNILLRDLLKQQKITNIYLKHLLNAVYSRSEYRLIGLEELQEVRKQIEVLDKND